MSYKEAGTVIYLDNAATSFPKPELVYTTMDTFARQIGGSGGRSSHRKAVESATTVDAARETIAELLGAPCPESVCFGLNASEALNTVIYGMAEPGQHIVTSAVEHNSVRRPLADLRTRFGCRITEVPTDNRAVWNPSHVIAALKTDTSFVILSWAGNVTGAIQEIEPVAKACRHLKIPLVLDGAQVCGAYPVDFKSLGIAALIFTGHKSLLGPQGTGGFIVDPDFVSRIRPLKRGGSGTVSHSEFHPEFLPDKFETGTLNCHGLSGLQAGASFVLSRGVESIRKHEMSLWRQLKDGLREIPHVKIFGPDDGEKSMSIISVTVDGMEPTDVGFILDMRFGILSRTGLHCAPGAHQAIGTLPTGTTRFSIGYSTNAEEIDTIIHALAHIREREKRSSVSLPADWNVSAAEVQASHVEVIDTPADRHYRVDRLGFLVDATEWDESFARGIASSTGIVPGLTEEHWRVIRFLRKSTMETGRCPIVYQTCKQLGIGLEDLQRLFPSGYLRGACKTAGISYETGSFIEPKASAEDAPPPTAFVSRAYPVNAHGYLLDPNHWDKAFAEGKAEELGIFGGLSDGHFQIIFFMREFFKQHKRVPTVFDTCTECKTSLEEMESLFPTGYHRGAVKTAGLHVMDSTRI